MLYVFVIVLGFLGVAAYLLVIFREVPGAVEERLGTLEALPEDIGQWKADDSSDEGRAAALRGELREVRLWQHHSAGTSGKEGLVEQVRYRNLVTNEICRSEPDRPIKRRRRREA